MVSTEKRVEIFENLHDVGMRRPFTRNEAANYEAALREQRESGNPAAASSAADIFAAQAEFLAEEAAKC